MMTKDKSASIIQKEIWFDQLIHPEALSYIVSAYIAIDGPINPESFIRALKEVTLENPLLCARFNDIGGVPVYDIATDSASNQAEIDALIIYSDWSKRKQAKELFELWIDKEIHTPFNLHHQFLFKHHLIKMADDRFCWFFKYHHIIVDGLSSQLVVEQVARKYESISGTDHTKQQKPVSELTPYSDFTKATHTYLTSNRYDQDKAFWLTQFDDLPAPLFPPHPTSAGPSQTRRSTINLPRAFFERLTHFCEANRHSINHLFLNALACYLARAYQCSEVMIGILIAHRRPHDRNTVGSFSSICPLRLHVASDRPTSELSHLIKAQLRQNYRHKSFPLSELNRALHLTDTGRRHLFDITLSYEPFNFDITFNQHPSTIQPVSAGLNHVPLHIAISNLHLHNDPEVNFDYDSPLFSDEDIRFLQDRFLWVLEQLLDNPRVADINILPPKEAQLIGKTFAHGPSLSPLPHITELFTQQARRTPTKPAVVFQDNRLSYDDLDQRIQRYAALLHRAGITAGQRVGVCSDRGADLPAILLSIFTIGAIYVPLDPEYPTARLTYVIGDADLSLLICHTAKEIPHLPGLPVLKMTEEIEPAALDIQVAGTTHSETAYILYTSGSTGRPKGVQISHCALSNFLLSMREQPGMDDTDRFLAVTTIAFDISLLELLLPLICGATLHIADRDTTSDGHKLAAYIDRHAISMMQATPATWQLLLLSGWQGALASPFKILTGGEALSGNLAHALLLCGSEVWNLYGPTETTIWSTVKRLDPTQPDSDDQTVVSIGKPIHNTVLYLLGDDLKPVPLGLPGDLYIGGQGVSEGYYKRPNLNAEKFVTLALDSSGTHRFFFTGDRARFSPDGNLHFLGRSDRQLKIRGFRIEPAEIESVICQHEAVNQAVVTVSADPADPSDKHLVAYVVPTHGPLELKSLEHHIQQQLPRHMIPSFIIPLDKIPLTQNLKIDISALPPPVTAAPSDADSAAHRTLSVEENLMAHYWTEVLKISPTHPHDSFFNLGGDSLRAMTLIMNLRETHQINLSIRDIFEHPTLSELVAFSGLTASVQPGSGLANALTMSDREIADTVPLTHQQRKIWLLEQTADVKGAYILSGELVFSGSMQPEAMEKAFDHMLSRHSIFKAEFFEEANQLFQRINHQAIGCFEIVDGSSYEDAEKKRLHHELGKHHATTPFSLAQAPLLRGTLFKWAHNDYRLFLSMHHIVADGRSIEIFLSQLATVYRESLHARSIPIPDGAPYTAYALAQADTPVSSHDLAFWCEHLAGAPHCIELPLDYKRPKVPSFHGAVESFSIPESSKQTIEFLAKTQHTTPFIVLFSAFSLFVAKLSGQNDLVIGTPIINRPAAFKETIGFFANTLAIRQKLHADDAFETVIAQTQQTCLNAFEHAATPFDHIVKALKLNRDTSHSPLFQVMFVLEEGYTADFSDTGIALEALKPISFGAKFDLTLTLQAYNGGYDGTFEYATDIFSPTTIALFATYFKQFLDNLDASGQTVQSHISLLPAVNPTNPDGDHRAMMTSPVSSGQSIIQVIEQRAQQQPEAIAVCHNQQTLLFRELNLEANKLARYLRHLGVHDGIGVGVYQERSIECMIAVLAVLKTGGIYIPLDLDWPQDRLHHILQDAGINFVIGNNPGGMSEKTMRWIDRSQDAAMIQTQMGANGNYVIPDDATAYVIYTSGSTGEPKGVAISYGALHQHIHSMADSYQLTPADNVLQFASLSFDPSIEQILTSLTSGATLVLRDKEPWPPITFMDKLFEHQISVINLPPAYLKMLLQGTLDLQDRTPPCLRLIISGGDVLSTDIVALWKQSPFAHAALYNAYGPTESTITATLFPITRTYTPANGVIPIGKAVAGKQIMIVDDHLRLVPKGVYGELCISGHGLMKGYLNRPDLTAKVMVPSPLAAPPQDHILRTGDRARVLSDGNIEYQGRIDQQVKLRGYRIDLEEIDSVLKRHEAVSDAVTILHTNTDRNSLITYFIPRPHIPDSLAMPSKLKAYLQAKLPAYMVPSRLIVVKDWPLTVNGKIDKRQLPAPSAQSRADDHHGEPRNPVEKLLVAIWQEILRISPIGIHDNFFDLGGDSIQGIQIAGRAVERGMKFNSQQLFEHQTIASLSQVITETEPPGTSDAVPVIATAHLTPIQTLFFDTHYHAPHFFNQSVLINVDNQVNVNQLFRALNRLQRQHPQLNVRFEQEQGRWQQRLLDEPHQMLETVHDFSNLSAAQANEKLIQYSQDIKQSLNHETGRLFASALFLHVKGTAHKLLISIHHLVVDGVSWRLLLQDLNDLYSTLSSSSQSIKLVNNYFNWSNKLYDYAQTDKPMRSLEFWLTHAQMTDEVTDENDQQQMDDAPTPSAVCDTTITTVLSPEATDQLLTQSNQAFHTEAQDLLLTALSNTLLEHPTFQAYVDLESHGREALFPELDISQTCGWFTVIAPFMLAVHQQDDAAQRIKTIKERLRWYKQHALDFGLLRYSCERDDVKAAMSRIRQPDICFNYLGQLHLSADDTPDKEAVLRTLADESTGPDSSEKNRRRYTLEINAMITNGVLITRWNFDSRRTARTAIADLADRFTHHLRELITFTMTYDLREFTASDFTLAGLDEHQFDILSSYLTELGDDSRHVQ